MTRDPLNVLVVSHAAVIGVNQVPFDALARDGARVTIVAPASLRTDLRGRLDFEALPGSAARAVTLPVSLGGYRAALGGQRGIHVIVYRGLARAIAAASPDVVFVEEEPHSFAARQVAATGARFVVHENQNIARRLPPPFASIRRAVLARAAGVTVRNEPAIELVRALGFTGPVGMFPHAAEGSDAAAADVGFARPVVGFAGRLVPEKGIMELIEAMRGIEASLLVVGDGPLRARATQEAGVRASFIGSVPHESMPAYFAAMDVVVVPSMSTPTWKEQFGRIVIEANACGVPVVVSDSGELARTVASTGGGVVVPEGNVEALRAAIRDLLANGERRRALGVAGKAAVAQRYSPEAIARELHRFLREVCA